jgi:hypothetical protein
MAMRRYLAVVLVLSGVAFAASAQRGVARGASSGRGSSSAHTGASFAGRSTTGFSHPGTAGFSHSSPAGFRGFFPTSRYRDASGYPSAARPLGVPSALRPTRPSFYTRRPVGPWRPGRPIAGRGPWDHREHLGLGPGDAYGSAGWIAPAYLSYCDPDFDDCYGGTGYYGQEGYADRPGSDISTAAPQPGYDSAQLQPYAPPYSEAYASPGQQPEASQHTQASAPTETEDVVTLIFKDGRPPEKIRNYALTRTTLYVIRDGRRHDIPVSDLDLAATQRANQEEGVSFQLPHAATAAAR